ncbi:MAG: hypothetical protein AAF367_00785 [Pseudomonadota bacterium]
MDAPTDHHLTLPEALARTGREIGRLHQIGLDLQDALGELISVPTTSSDDTMQRLQMLDQLTQELQDLSAFLDHLGRYSVNERETGSDTVSHALSSLRLVTLRNRLLNVAPADADSEIDLF